MSLERFNYDNNGNLPSGGAPIYANDLASIDRRYTEAFKNLLEGMFDYNNANYDLAGIQSLNNKNFIISGCEPTITEVLADVTYNLAITEGLAFIDGEICKVEAQNINFPYSLRTFISAPLSPAVVLNRDFTEEARTYENATTNVTKVNYTATLSNTASAQSIIWNVNDTTADTDVLRLVNILGAFQEDQQARKAKPNEYRGLTFNIWEFDLGGNGPTSELELIDKQQTISGKTVTYQIPFRLINAASHIASSTKRVWVPLFDFLPSPTYRLKEVSAKVCVVNSGGTYSNDVLCWFDSSGYLCMDRISGTWADSDLVIFMGTYAQ